MSISGINSWYSASSLYGSSQDQSISAALAQILGSAGGTSSSSSAGSSSISDELAQILGSTSDSSISSSSVSQMQGPPPPPSSADMQAALDKLSTTDPTLAKKLESFQEQMEQLKDSGASADTIESTMKSNMDSLSDTEKSELESIFGGQESGGTDGPGAPPNIEQDLVNQLGTTDSTLANKIKGFQDDVNKLKSSGASQDTINQTISSDISSLSDSEKTEVQNALTALFKEHAPANRPNDSTTSTSTSSASTTTSTAGDTQSSASTLAYMQMVAAYLHAQTSQTDNSLAYAA